MSTTIARLESVTKKFGSFTACDSITLDVNAGEVLALLGENGAGKSTLMKVLFGVHQPDGGEVLIDGRPADIDGPADAMAAGIGMVFQQFSLIPALSVRDNLLMAWPRTPYLIGRGRPGVDAVLDNLRRLAPSVDPDKLVADLAVGEQQLVELCKVLNLDARIVILDEPTAVLTPSEARNLHRFVRELAQSGIAVVLITHKLADVSACADRIVVMRRGAVVETAKAGEKPLNDLVSSMMGGGSDRDLAPPPRPEKREIRLKISKASAAQPGIAISGIDLEIARGEIVGVAGVTGNGQSLLAEVVTGVRPLDRGDVELDGKSVARRSLRGAHSTAIGYVPEQPRENGVVESLDLTVNLGLRKVAPVKSRPAGNDLPSVERLLESFDVRPREPRRKAGTLSGGNLQKLVIARELGAPRPAVLLVYPTMGLDLAATAAVYRTMFEQAAAGSAVLWISEELDDLITAAHRIVVMREGSIVADIANGPDVSREAIGALMTGMDN
ncbi:MAG: ABC transporter ATP-binding protein [Flavobacteriaceae bacterium]